MTRHGSVSIVVGLILVSLLHFHGALDAYRGSDAYRAAEAYVHGSDELTRLLGPSPGVRGVPTGRIDDGEADLSLTVGGRWREARVRIRLLSTGRRWHVIDAAYELPRGAAGVLVAEDAESIRRAMRHAARGYALYQNGLHEEALVELSRAVSAYPRHEAAYFWRGWVYTDLGEYERALADQHRAIAMDPEYPEAHQALAAIHGQRGDLESSVEHFDAAIALGGDDSTYYYGRGLTLLRLERFQGALSDFERACSLGHTRSCGAADGTRPRVTTRRTGG